MVLRHLVGLLFAARIFTSGVVGALVYWSAIRSGVTGRLALWGALPLMLSSMGGFCLNDVCDRRKDAINKPYRALPAGLVTIRMATMASLILLTLSCLLIFLNPLGSKAQCLQATVLIGITAYNLIVRRFGVVKAIYTGLLAGVPYLFVAFVWRNETTAAGFVMIVVPFVAGRELLMDVLDMPGDEVDAVCTLPLFLGAVPSQWLGFGLQFLAMALLIAWARVHRVPSSVALAEAVAILVGMAALCWCFSPSRRNRMTIITALWAPMLLATAIFLRAI